MLWDMVLSINVTEQTEMRLRQQAQAAGKEVSAYVSELIESAAARRSLDELLAPIRRQFAQSGVSDDQLIADITEAQADYRAEQRKKTA